MEKKAILVRGEPVILDEVEKFKESCKKNLYLMSEIAIAEGYSVQQTLLENVIKSINRSFNVDDFLFYFTGHANKDYLGTLDYKTNDILRAMDGIKGNKLIILDACAGGYPGGQNFDALTLPKKSKIISAKDVYDNKSLAKLFYDLVMYRKTPLDQITKESFDLIKQNWVYFKINK